jgi:hypothetical protein
MTVKKDVERDLEFCKLDLLGEGILVDFETRKSTFWYTMAVNVIMQTCTTCDILRMSARC